MKKIIFLFLALIISVSIFSQQINPSPTITKQDYLQKSKKQKTAAWIFLAGGGGLATTGLAIGISSADEEFVDLFTGDKDNTYEIGAVMFFTGLASMLGSIPLFIASSKNMKKGMSLSLKNETIPQLTKQNFAYKTIPSLSVKINL
jgi:Ca2+/Na+ antiporter